jgi:general secretion pathway protein N
MAQLKRSSARQAGAARRLGLVLLAVIGFLMLIVVAAPAGLAARILEVADGPVRLAAPAGRLWAGSGDLYLEGQALGRLRWTLLKGRLLEARLAFTVDLAAPGHQGQAELALAPNGTLNVSRAEGEVREATLDALLEPYAIEPSGSIRFRDGSARVVDRRLATASADGRWSGGPVSYRLGGQVWRERFPPLDATLRAEEGRPLLVVRDPQGEELLDLALERDGWAQIRIRYRFVALAGFPWPDAPSPETVVLELAEQIY